MTDYEFTSRIDGLINDFVGGISDDRYLQEGILNILIEIRADAKPRNLNEYRDSCHAMALNKGFHEVNHRTGPKIRIRSEPGECFEEDWNHLYTDDTEHNLDVMLQRLNDHRFDQDSMDLVKDNVANKLADTMIQIFDMAEELGVDLEKHIQAKMRSRSTRPQQHGNTH